MGFLPTTVKEMRALGWDAPDVILVTGDAYIDHPSFGTAVIARLLEAEGFPQVGRAETIFRGERRKHGLDG